MPTPEELDRIHIVLVRARNPNNIGAAARAMHDFGLRHLRVVNDYTVPFESARSAVDASEVLADAVACATLAEAIADCTLVVGTTAVGERDLQHPLLPLPKAAPSILAELRRNTGPNSAPGRVALLFGSEKTGLSNDELSHCNFLLTIPMQQREGERHLSLNLGQAVAVCLYEISRTPAQPVPAHPDIPSLPVPEAPKQREADPISGELDRLAQLIEETMEAVNYTTRGMRSANGEALRVLLRRLMPNDADLRRMMGLFRRILWQLKRPHDKF